MFELDHSDDFGCVCKRQVALCDGGVGDYGHLSNLSTDKLKKGNCTKRGGTAKVVVVVSIGLPFG